MSSIPIKRSIQTLVIHNSVGSLLTFICILFAGKDVFITFWSKFGCGDPPSPWKQIWMKKGEGFMVTGEPSRIEIFCVAQEIFFSGKVEVARWGKPCTSTFRCEVHNLMSDFFVIHLASVVLCRRGTVHTRTLFLRMCVKGEKRKQGIKLNEHLEQAGFWRALMLVADPGSRLVISYTFKRIIWTSR